MVVIYYGVSVTASFLCTSVNLLCPFMEFRLTFSARIEL